MSLTDLVKKRRLQHHKATRDEIHNLMDMARRSFADAQVPGLSIDWRYMIAYNAALCSASMILHAAGFRPRGEGHHATLFEALPLALPAEKAAAGFFDACRRKRNTMTYAAPTRASEKEVQELLEQAKAFYARVEQWLVAKHPKLMPPPPTPPAASGSAAPNP